MKSSRLAIAVCALFGCAAAGVSSHACAESNGSDVPDGLRILGPKEPVSSGASSVEKSPEKKSDSYWKKWFSAGSSNSETAKSLEAASERSSRSRGPYSLVEWNAGDLLFKRGRVSAEYVVTNGMALGFSSEYQSMANSTWANRTVAAGAIAAQYFENLGLSGFFMRGELDLFHSKFSKRTEVKSDGLGLDTDPRVTIEGGNTFGVMLGGDLGQRIVLTRLLSTSVGLGVRRTVPEFFSTKINSNANTYATHEGLWQVRMNLGFALGF